MGQELKNIMSSGKFVSDDIVLKLVSKKITSSDCKNGFILDGFPRNLSQATSLDSLLNNLNLSIEYVFLIDVPTDLIIKRCVGRITCNTCGKIENEYFSDFREGDKCGEGGFLQKELMIMKKQSQIVLKSMQSKQSQSLISTKKKVFFIE